MSQDTKTDLFYEPDDATRAKWEAWVSERPEIAAYATRLPPWNCYRKRGQYGGHYSIHSYNPDGTVTLNHGRDSFLPGVQVFGVPANEVEPCGCGRWRWPTEAQIAHTGRHIERMRRVKASKAKIAASKKAN